LQHPERWQIGRTYSELFTDGQTIAASGLKKVLLKVKGFDFVPEDLRSSTFIKVANEILTAHEGMNNFYNEPKPVSTLYNMGSVIPTPAFPICITAILSVKLGNSYGVSNAAQGIVNEMLKNISSDRWIYFFKECLQYNDRLLYKLMDYRPLDRWLSLFPESLIDKALLEVQEKDLINLLNYTKKNDRDRLMRLAGQMYRKIGYTNK
jgi:energy-converting hydrogenase Eha subunit A